MQRAAWHIKGRAPDGVRDLVERDLVPAQGCFRHLDGDLVVGHAADLGLADVRHGNQAIAYPLGDRLQRYKVRIAGDGDVHDLAPGDQLADDRPLGFDGKRIDLLNVVGYFMEHLLLVCAQLELHDYRGAALGRRRHDLLDAVDVLN